MFNSTNFFASVSQREMFSTVTGTSSLPNDYTDRQSINAVASESEEYLDRQDKIIINKFKVPIGAGSGIKMSILDNIAKDYQQLNLIGTRNHRHSDRPVIQFDVVSNFKLLREGLAIYDTLNPAQIW
jgi:UDP-glucose 6-dehydrogenase